MKKTLLALGVFSALTLGTTIYFTQFSECSVNGCSDEETSHMPAPTEVNMKMENEEEMNSKRREYIDLIHGGDHVDWRAIEKQNKINRMQWVAELKKTKAVESYANGAIAGEWHERGSVDQAGNARITAYDPDTDAIYTIGDGGVLFKGHISGNTWTSQNDQFLIDPDVLLSIRIPGNTVRLLTTIGNGVWYTDDEGATWVEGTGFFGSTWDGSGIDMVELNDADSTLVYLYTYMSVSGGTQNKLAYSKDHGASWIIDHIFSGSNPDLTSMCMVYNADVCYILDKDDDTWRFEDDGLTQLADNMNLPGGSSCQIEATVDGADTVLYVLMDSNELLKSTDAGYTFTQLPDLPTNAWDVGIGTSIDDPNALYYGEVDLYRSADGGNTFTKVSDWWEYYSDVANKIHADIMNLQTFKTSTGTEFTLIPNHGGVSISYDNLNSTPNISMQDLNIGQFYDVATSPVNSSLIMGGTQDQGLQRTLFGDILAEVGFEQVISGDYGSQQYSNNGLSFWTVYPFGGVSYYTSAEFDGGYTFWEDIPGNNLPAAGWIIPTGSAPNPADDWILVGGGNTSGGNGSYLIKMEHISGAHSYTQYSTDFEAESNGGLISAIETTPFDEDRWYVSTDNGKFYYSNDAGVSFTEATDNGPGGNWLYSADIYASRLEADMVILAGTNYFGSPVHISTDGGDTFTALDGGDKPTAMVHEICMDEQENFIFAASDAGPYVYDMNAAEWFYLGGIYAPIQDYYSVEFIETDQVVRFATYGRGIWDFKLSDVTGIKDPIEHEAFKPYPNPSNGQFSLDVTDFNRTKIFNMQGQEVAQIALVPGTNNLNLSFLEKGAYIMVSASSTGTMWSEKLVIE